MRRAMRSGRPANSRTTRELSMQSGYLRHDCNYIARRYRARLNYFQIEAAHAPVRRSVVSRFHARFVDFLFDGGAVYIEGGARSARLGDLDQGAAGAQAVAEAEIVDVDSAGGEVLAERTELHGIAAAL